VVAFAPGCGGGDGSAPQGGQDGSEDSRSPSSLVRGSADPSPDANSTTDTDSASTPTTTAAPSTTVAPAWDVGATALALRPDGFGQVLPTPAPLVDRRLPTASELPAPPTSDFHSTISPLDDQVLQRMAGTWQSGCPVAPEDLRYLTLAFWGFDGDHHTGELVVHRDVAEEVVWVFARLHEAQFPIEEMRLVTGADLDAPPTGDGNNTAAFVCRPVRQGGSWSAHAYGTAIDLNPFHNPYRRGDLVLPELASAYLDRANVRPGMVVAGDVATNAFAEIGWSWGGQWSSPDLMHFSASGR
jgi:hypothetical protein